MSQIASLYVLQRSLLPDLIAASTQQVEVKKNWLGKVTHYHHPFQSFLQNNATEISSDAGALYLTLYMYIEEKSQLDWAAMELQHEVGDLSGFLFSYRDAQQLIPVLDPQKHAMEDLQQFAAEEMEDDPEAANLLLNAISNLRQALLTLKESDILFLSIG